MEDTTSTLAISIAKMQVTQDLILAELKDLKPRITWLETKANYALGIIAGLAVFSDFILKKIGIK